LLPGVWEVTSGECARQVDHKKTKGKDGARIKDQGLLPARFTATGHVIHEDEWVELQLAIPDISPRRKGGLRTPFTIFHPAIALLGVTTVYVERIKAPEIKNGVLEIGIDMIEWTDQPKTARTGETPAAKGNGKGGSRAAQYLANSMATPVSQWYGHAVHVGPTPSDEQLAAWNRSGGSVEEYFRIQSTGRPSQSVVSEFENQRGTRAGGQ
jgi:hypothetical protein